MSFRTDRVKQDANRIQRWPRDRGAEVLIRTNDWELLRFKANGQTSIVYYNTRSIFVTCTGEAERVLDSFYHATPWRAGVRTSKKNSRELGVITSTVLARDGELCFYCHQPLGDDITREHLVSRSAGGPDHAANIVLTHAVCNHEAGTLSAMEKIKIRERNADHHSTEGQQARSEAAEEGADPPR